ncbi:hypothetical protein OAT67_03815 [Bacteriovoracaceae bacterium]|nr:hypothetical protein [Bacteriovoracaceae bacterium]
MIDNLYKNISYILLAVCMVLLGVNFDAYGLGVYKLFYIYVLFGLYALYEKRTFDIVHIFILGVASFYDLHVLIPIYVLFLSLKMLQEVNLESLKSATMLIITAIYLVLMMLHIYEDEGAHLDKIIGFKYYIDKMPMLINSAFVVAIIAGIKKSKRLEKNILIIFQSCFLYYLLKESEQYVFYFTLISLSLFIFSFLQDLKLSLKDFLIKTLILATVFLSNDMIELISFLSLIIIFKNLKLDNNLRNLFICIPTFIIVLNASHELNNVNLLLLVMLVVFIAYVYIEERFKYVE